MTYKAQLALGLHVIVMMFTFFAAGHVGTSYFSAEPVHVRYCFSSQQQLWCLLLMHALWPLAVGCPED